MKNRQLGRLAVVALGVGALHGSVVLGCSDEPAAPKDFEGLGGSDGGPIPTELRLTFRRIPLGVSWTTDIVFLPGSSEFLVTSSGGELVHGKLEGLTATTLGRWTIEEVTVPEAACGLTNVLLDPEFSQNRFIYVSYCIDDAVTRLVRYRWDEQGGPKHGAVIFETVIDEPRDLWHRFGSMGFEEDGETLWILSGDHFIHQAAQDVANPLGAVLRLLPNRDEGGLGHELPDGNMASLGDGDVHPALFAYGLRSPWRGTRDSLGRLWIGDVGLGKVEEVNLLTQVGQNFGWPIHEGPCRTAEGTLGEGGAGAQDECEGFSDPVAHHTRAGDDPYTLDDPRAEPATKRAIWVGEIYENPSKDRYAGLMDGVVPFGEYYVGWVRGLRADDEDEIIFDEHIGHLTAVTQWKVGPDGYAYALDLHGNLHRAVLER